MIQAEGNIQGRDVAEQWIWSYSKKAPKSWPFWASLALVKILHILETWLKLAPYSRSAIDLTSLSLYRSNCKSEDRNRIITTCQHSPLLLNIVLGVLATATREENPNDRVIIGFPCVVTDQSLQVSTTKYRSHLLLWPLQGHHFHSLWSLRQATFT